MNEPSQHPSLSVRRPSMAERRPSTITGPSVVPFLAGLEAPAQDTTPENVDVLICGTGMVESVLAAALSWQGSNVLHIDSNPYYGDTSATLTTDQLQEWVQNVNAHKLGFKGYSNAKLYIGANLQSRDFGIDLSPKILFCRSDLLSLLVKSRIHKYLEFQSLSNFHTFENDSFEKLSNTKQEIFTDQTLPLMTKRSIMRFITFVLNWEKQPEVWEAYKKKPIATFLHDKFKLEKTQIFELVFSIGLCYSINTHTPVALQRIRRYLASFDVYGAFPVMYSKFGGSGELSQGFCRSAAVAGATYKLNTSLVSYDNNTKIATFNDGSRATVSEKVIMSPSQSPEDLKMEYEVQRLTVVVNKTCTEWYSENEYAAVVVFPTQSLKTGNAQAVQVLIMGSETGVCSEGTTVWYITTPEKGPRGKLDLEAALEAMEVAILRESSADILDDALSPDGMMINSVKLGTSFKNFVPKEKLQILLKLYYTQHTCVPPFGVVTPSLFDIKESNGVLYTAMPGAEISYDEVVTAAKVLFEKIVGSDDDFFNVDFEDDEDESAIQDDIMESSAEPVEFAGEMEI